MWAVYEAIGTAVLILGVTFLLFTLPPIFIVKLVVLLPLVVARTAMHIWKAQRLLAAGTAHPGELDALIKTMQGLDARGRPHGFSWVLRSRRKSLAPRLLELRAKLSERGAYSGETATSDLATHGG